EKLSGLVEVHRVGVAQAVGDDLAALEVGGEAQHAAADRVLYRGRGRGDVLPGDARLVADEQVHPAVGAALDGVGEVLAPGAAGEEQFRRPRPALAAGVAVDAQPTVADAVEVLAVPAQPHRAVLRGAGEVQGSAPLPRALPEYQLANVAPSRDDDLPIRPERHA